MILQCKLDFSIHFCIHSCCCLAVAYMCNDNHCHVYILVSCYIYNIKFLAVRQYATEIWGNPCSSGIYNEVRLTFYIITFGCALMWRIEWWLHHLHSTKRAEVTQVFCAANSAGTDNTCTCRLHDSMSIDGVQWNLIITVILGPKLVGCCIEVAFSLSGIHN